MGFFDSLLGNDAADAANRAAQDTYGKQRQATQALTSYGDTLPGQYNQLSQAYQPYTQAGSGALQQLMAGLGLGGAGAQGQFTQAYQNLPGYQSGLNTGLTGAQRALNAGNIGQSGRALKSLYRYGSDYEDQRSGDYLNRLAGLTGMGQAATGAQVGTQAQGLAGQQATRQSAYGGDMNSAGTIGQGMVAGAQAQQTGLQNLLGTAAYLGGSFLGGPAGGALGGSLFGGGGSWPAGPTNAPKYPNPYGGANKSWYA